MTYEQAILFLDSRIGAGWKLGLDSIGRLLADLGNPQDKLKCVHIAGTNGKGSTAAMLESICRNAGYRTGLYTSPHLLDVGERIQVDRNMIATNEFARLMQLLAPFIIKYNATYFETLTALAFLYFAEMDLDIVILETGLGGRLDATNVIVPILSIITTIDLEHTQHLGDTLEKIAGEKAGIAKPGVPCLIGDMPRAAEKVIRSTCKQQNAPCRRSSEMVKVSMLEEKPGALSFKAVGKKYSGDMQLGLNGAHQLANAAVAIAACDLLDNAGISIQQSYVCNGLKNINWPGRFQILGQNPAIVLDVAHNPASIRSLVALLKKMYQDKKIYFVIGVMKDKDVGQIAELISQTAFAVQPVAILDSFRAMQAHDLHSEFSQYAVTLYEGKSIADGVAHVFHQAERDAVVCITGSHYIAGEAVHAINSLTK